MDKIVVGVDASTGSQQALEWALEEAALQQAALRIVYVLPHPRPYYPYTKPELDRLERTARTRGRRGALLEAGKEHAQEMAQELLESALAKAGGQPTGVSVELVPRFGEASRELIEESRDASLLVVGSRGRGGFAGLMLGSVSQQVVQHAHCPVVVIRA